MSTEGADGRIILVTRPREARPPAAEPAEPPRQRTSEREPVRMAKPERTPRARTPRARTPQERPAASNWNARRLINGALLAGIATVVGGLIFQKNFQLFGDNNRQLLSIGFGLFVVGMVVLTLCLIGLAARGVRRVVAGQGWPAAVIIGYAPTVPLVLLNMVGILSYAFPAFFVIIVTGGFALALKQR
jgi:hypothetical protein